MVWIRSEEQMWFESEIGEFLGKKYSNHVGFPITFMLVENYGKLIIWQSNSVIFKRFLVISQGLIDLVTFDQMHNQIWFSFGKNVFIKMITIQLISVRFSSCETSSIWRQHGKQVSSVFVRWKKIQFNSAVQFSELKKKLVQNLEMFMLISMRLS